MLSKQISTKKLNNLLLGKYHAEIISKQQFKNAIYGLNRDDISDDISTLTEGIIDSENVLPLKGSYKVLINNKQYMLTDNHINYKNGCVDISFI